MATTKFSSSTPVRGSSEMIFDETMYLKNTSSNLDSILRRTGWTQKRLAKEMDVSQSMMTEYVRGDRFPSLQSILRLINSKEIQKQIPFTIDQFLTGDVRDSDANSSTEYAWNQEESIHKDILGTYHLYFFDQKIQEVTNISKMRKLRYGILSLYETARKNGGVKVVAFSRFFKSVEEATAFRKELTNIDAPKEEQQEKEMTLYRSHDDSYTGSVSLIGNHIFIDLFSSFYNDKGMIILTAPEKKPSADYIGGLGNVISVTHGAEHVPVSQKIILSREAIFAPDEEIAAHLLYGSVRIDIDGEMEALLNLLNSFNSLKENGGALDFLDRGDKRAVIQHRIQQLAQKNIDRTFYGLCLVSKKDDSACYQFLKRQMER